MNYYIADPHFGHSNIIHHTDRPFRDAAEMDKFMIANWNARVNKDDHVYIVGDFSFRSTESVDTYLRQLKGIKHLIIGNHDFCWMNKVDLSAYFEEVGLMLLARDEKQAILLCHYPLMTVPRGYIQVYGHIHNNTHEDFWKLLSTYENAFNAAVELNNYMPVPLPELIANNQRFKAEWRETVELAELEELLRQEEATHH